MNNSRNFYLNFFATVRSTGVPQTIAQLQSLDRVANGGFLGRYRTQSMPIPLNATSGTRLRALEQLGATDAAKYDAAFKQYFANKYGALGPGIPSARASAAEAYLNKPYTPRTMAEAALANDALAAQNAGARAVSPTRWNKGQILKDATAAGMSLGLVGAAIGYLSVKAAAGYQSLIQTIQANAFIPNREKNYIAGQIIPMASRTTATYQQLADAYAKAEYYGLRGKTATNAVLAAAMSAIPSGGNPVDVVKALGIAQNDFGINPRGKGAFDLVNMFHMAAARSAESLPDFLQGTFQPLLIGSLVQRSRKGLAQTLGEVSALTRALGGGTQAGNQIRTMQVKMLDPSKATETYLSSLYGTGKGRERYYRDMLFSDFSYGGKNGGLGLKQKGFAGVLNDLARSGLTEGQITKIFPNIRGLMAALDLTFGAGHKSATAATNAIAAAPKQDWTQKVFANYMKTTAAQAKVLERNIQALGVAIGQALLPPLNAVLGVIGPFAGWLAQLAGEHKIVSAGLIGIALAVGGVSLAIRGLMFFGGPLATMFEMLTGKELTSVGAMVAQKVAMAATTVASYAMTAAQWALNVAMDANPIFLVVTAVAALGAGFYLAYTHIKPFREAVQGVFSWIKNAIGSVVGYITKNWKTLLPELLLAPLTMGLSLIVPFLLQKFAPGLSKTLGKVWSDVTTGILNFGKDAWNAFTGALSSMVSWVTSHWQQLLLAAITGPFLGPISLLFAGLPAKFLQWGENALGGFIQGIKNQIPSLGNIAQDALSAIGNFLGFGSPNPNGDDPAKWGRNMIGGAGSNGSGFVDGMNRQLPQVKLAGAAVLTNAFPVNSAYLRGYNAGKSSIDGYNAGVASVKPVSPITTVTTTSISGASLSKQRIISLQKIGGKYFYASGMTPESWGVTTGPNHEVGYRMWWGGKAVGDYDFPFSHGTAVKLPGKGLQYKFLGFKEVPGVGIIEGWQTPTGGHFAFLHLAANSVTGMHLQIGQWYKSGKVVAFSGGQPGVDPGVTTKYSNGAHLCVVVDSAGQQFLAWITNGQMANAYRAGRSLSSTTLISASGKYAVDMFHSGIPSHWGLFLQAAQKYNIPPALLAAIAWGESHGGNNKSAQILGYTLGSARDWGNQVFGGAKTLRALLDQYHGNLEEALLHYGPGTGKYPGYIMQFYRGFRPGGTSGSWSLSANGTPIPGTPGGTGSSGSNYGPLAHWKWVEYHNKWMLWDLYNGKNPKYLTSSQFAGYEKLEKTVAYAQYKVTWLGLEKKKKALAKQLAAGTINGSQYKSAMSIVSSEEWNAWQTYQKKVDELTTTAANMGLVRGIASMKWQISQLDSKLSGVKPWTLGKKAQDQWIHNKQRLLKLQEQATIAEDRLAFREGHIGSTKLHQGIRDAIKKYRQLTHNLAALIPVEHLRRIDSSYTTEEQINSRHWLTGFKFTGASQSAIATWLRKEKRNLWLRLQIQDNEAKILYLEGLIGKRRYAKLLSANAADYHRSVANAISRANSRGIGLSGRAVPVHIIGRCAAEAAANKHRSKTANYMKQLVDLWHKYLSHLAAMHLIGSSTLHHEWNDVRAAKSWYASTHRAGHHSGHTHPEQGHQHLPHGAGGPFNAGHREVADAMRHTASAIKDGTTTNEELRSAVDRLATVFEHLLQAHQHSQGHSSRESWPQKGGGHVFNPMIP